MMMEPYGSSSVVGALAPLESGSMITSALQAFHVDLAFIRNDEKLEYLEALDNCPELLKTEANPLKFLRVEKYDTRAAAKRFVLYWKYRKEAFGPKRAFLPLKIGQALTEEDVELMKTGYLAFLPQNSNGEAVVVLEHDRVAPLPRLPEGYARVRMAFWLIDLVSQATITSQTHGVAAVFVVTPFGYSLNRTSESPLKALLKALPIKYNFQYLVHASQGITSYFLPLMLNLYSGFVDQLLVPVCGSTNEEIYAKLLASGVETSAIPPSLGGSFSYESNTEYFLRNSVAKQTTASVAVDGGNEKRIGRALAAMPLASKADYVEALRRVPLVVDCESPIARFAACESPDDTGAVVRRLLAYWKARRVVFGDRAFLPLTLSGQDALTADDLRYLDRGFAAVLPPDAKGHPVLYLDFSRFDGGPGVSAMSVNRLWFYCVQVGSQFQAAQSKGIVVLLTLPEKLNGSLFDLVLDAMPVKLHIIHLLMLRSRSLRTSSLKAALQEALSAVGCSGNPNLAIHMLPSAQEMLSRLECLGFHRSSLPVSLGGQWRFDIELPIWKYQQTLKEENWLGKLENGKRTLDVYGVDESDEEDESPMPNSTTGETNGHSVPAVELDDGASSVATAITIDKASIHETAEMMSNGLYQLREALSLLPPEEKLGYEECLRRAPDLVNTEAPLLPFLRIEGYNTWASAQRVASYWATRTSIFGERAMLEMNQTGEGTLSRDDVQALGNGDTMLLPYDKRGRSVFFYDASRIPGGNKDRKLRLSLYLWSIASENRLSQLEGCRIILKLERAAFDTQLSHAICRCLEVLPVRIHSAIVTCSPDNLACILSLRKAMVNKVPKFVSNLSENFTLVLADSKAEMAAKFHALDIACDGLPESLGGTWSDGQFTRWQESRFRYEWRLPSLNVRDHLMPHIPRYETKPRSQLTEIEKVERKRRRNVLNSRRKRDRTRAEVSGLQEQVFDLRKRNRNLELEHDRLIQVLKSANVRVTQQEIGSQLSTHSTKKHVNGECLSAPALMPGQVVLPPSN